MIVARGLGRSAFVGAIVAVGLCIGAPAQVEADVPEYHGGGKSVSVEYVRDLFELQELRLKGRIEPASAPDIVGDVDRGDVAPESQPLVADVEIVPPIALAIDPVQAQSLAVDGNQIAADAAKAVHAAKLKRNKAALLLILAEL